MYLHVIYDKIMGNENWRILQFVLIFVQLTQCSFFIYVTITLSYVTMMDFNVIPYFEPKKVTRNNV